MRIILVAPVEGRVPPAAYGGIEHVVHLLDEDLSARGHEVMLLACGGSSAASRLVEIVEQPLGRPKHEGDLESFRRMKNRAAQHAAAVIADERPDIVLNHSWRLLDHLQTSLSLTTVHFPLDAEPYRSIFWRETMRLTYPSARRKGEVRRACGSQGPSITESMSLRFPSAPIEEAIWLFSDACRRTRGLISRSAPPKKWAFCSRLPPKSTSRSGPGLTR
jgi:hypothetical protein